MIHYGKLQFRIAHTKELIQATQRLRYRVFVEEQGWEKPADHPQGLETDIFDPNSLHAAAIDGAGEVVGTARLVLNSPQGLPIFRHLDSLDGLNRHSPRLAEFSRLCVHPDLNPAKGPVAPHRDQQGIYRFPGARPDTTPSQDARMLSLVTHGLIFALYQAGILLKHSHWFIITERKLWVFLRRRGIVFRAAGKPVEFHGTRTPYIARLDEFGHGVAKLHFDTKQTATVPDLDREPTRQPEECVAVA